MRRNISSQQLLTPELFPSEPPARSWLPSPSVSQPVDHRSAAFRLWLCLHFPLLPLEVVNPRAGHPCGVLEEDRGRYRILACCSQARDKGIQKGMAADAALALVPGLCMYSRDVSAENRALESLADLAYSYSSAVSVEPPQSLLVEIHGSLRMFGGLEALQYRIGRELQSAGYGVYMASAPSATAALWLSRADIQCSIQDVSLLRSQLSILDISVTGWPHKTLTTLRRMGVRQLGDCLRLPRDGLARRAGPWLIEHLDQALCLVPETRSCRHPDEVFRRTLLLPCETDNLRTIRAGLKQILVELQGWLRARQAGVRSLLLKFHHTERPPDQLRVGMLQARDDTIGMLELANLRLEALGVQEPVISLELQADGVEARQPLLRDMLLEKDVSARQGTTGLMERLSSRLGRGAVFGIELAAESRPESAWCKTMPRPGRPNTENIVLPSARRPLWLLQRPAALKVRGHQPVHGGPLEMESGPERIETGWWDGRDIRRDYYIARSQSGQSLWVFEDIRQNGHWYLHGAFG